MPAGRRQLFVYWRCAGTDTPPALAAAQALQRTLRTCHMGLLCSLYLRCDANAPDATLMETYAVDAGLRPEGLDAMLQQAIEAAAVEALLPWQSGARHVEVFDAVEN